LTELNGFFGSSGAFVAFDIAAWQFLFVCGVMIGQNGKTVHSQIKKTGSWHVAITLAGLLALSVLLRANSLYPNPLNLTESMPGNLPRLDLHPVFLLRIVVAAAAIALILIRNDIWLRPAHTVMRWYFGLALLRNVGKHSIKMFVFHVYIMALYKGVFASSTDQVKLWFAVFWILAFMAVPNLWAVTRHRNEGRA
jgi:hypothetical protein